MCGTPTSWPRGSAGLEAGRWLGALPGTQRDAPRRQRLLAAPQSPEEADSPVGSGNNVMCMPGALLFKQWVQKYLGVPIF